MSKYKDKKPSMIEFTRKYANNDQACEDFYTQSCIYMFQVWSLVMPVCRNNLPGL